MKTITQDIKTGSFHPVYLLFGEEAYLKRNCRERLTAAVLGEDRMNLNDLRDQVPEISEVIDLAETMPFFADHRLILLENTGWFKKDSGDFPDYLDRMPESTILVFSEEEVDKRNRLFKKVSTLGHAAVLDHPNPKDLAAWAAGYLKRNGKKITGNTMELFLTRVGNDMERVQTELDKLIAYTGEDEVVTGEAVETISTRLLEDRIFDMIGAVTAGEPDKALALYYDLLSLKEAPVKILVLITRQYRQMLMMKELLASGKDPGTAAQEMKLTSFAADRLRRVCHGYSEELLGKCLQLCIESDEAVKTGRLSDSMALEMLIVQLSSIREEKR